MFGMMSAAPPNPGHKIVLWAIILVVSFVIVGMTIKPSEAYYRYPWLDESYDKRLSHAPLVAVSRLRQYSFWDRLIAVSYQVEGPTPWNDNTVSGCNDKWTITSYTIYGIQLDRVEVLCDGVDMRAVELERGKFRLWSYIAIEA